jgi:NitT/TauT family transport system substrate-binding protein
VDAISTWEPHIYNAQKELTEKAVLLAAKDIFREDFYFVAFKDFIKENPKAIMSFLKAIQRAEEFIRKNRDESIDIVVKRLSLDKGFVSSVWGDFSYRLMLDQSILWCLEDEARWAIKNKLVEAAEVPNYLNYVYFKALEEIDPEAVTIIR